MRGDDLGSLCIALDANATALFGDWVGRPFDRLRGGSGGAGIGAEPWLRASWTRGRFARWRPNWTCVPRSSAGRTVHDANTVRRIVAASGITPDDVVLEIGPGLGSLTLGLLEVAKHVTAIEIESSLARRLPATVEQRLPDASGRLTVVEADALDVTELPGPPPTAVVANLPYNVSVPVLLHLCETFDSWTRGLVMVQLEVADRLVAGPGSRTYGVPSVKLAWFADVPRGHGASRGVLARAERRLWGWSASCATNHPKRRRPETRSSP